MSDTTEYTGEDIDEMISEEELAVEKAAQEEGAEVEYDDKATSEGE